MVNMNFKHFIYIIFFCILLSSCRVTKSNQISTDEPQNIITDTVSISQEPSFTNVFLKADCELISNNNSTNFNANIIIIHDSVIWISATAIAGIEAFRILCTIDSIKIIDRLNKEYYASTYQEINNKMGICINFNLLEALITAKESKSLQKEILQKNIDSTYSDYTISQIIDITNDESCHFLQKIKLSSMSNRILQNEINYLDKGTLTVVFNYDEYISQDSLFIPQKINIDIKTLEGIISQIIMNIKQIKINQTIATPFSKPNWNKSSN
ncbi:MAG: DUF4292 domain-containing protein [Bacteroidales bacterium]|nr:DUF4292 domain-containing protein [Bacteroidales bacterium]